MFNVNETSSVALSVGAASITSGSVLSVSTQSLGGKHFNLFEEIIYINKTFQALCIYCTLIILSTLKKIIMAGAI